MLMNASVQKSDFKMQHMKWIHQNQSTKSVETRFIENEDVTQKKRSQKASTATQKRCNKIRFQQFRVSTVAAAFLCLIDTWYNNSQFEGENKVISRFITIEFNSQKQTGQRNECWSNFQQHFFSSSHLKAGVYMRERRQRDRTVKNPSEAFNLLLQQNFISTLIFFMREKQGEDWAARGKNAIALYNRNKYFMFFHRRFVWEISFSPQWKLFKSLAKQRPEKNNISGILHKCIHVYIHILIFFACRAIRLHERKYV